MSKSEKKEREKRRKMEALLDAAEVVFSSKGLRMATIEDIAREAGVSVGTIYLYFKTKEHLYLGIDVRGSRILRAMFIKAAATGGTGRQRVVEIGRAYRDFAHEFPLYFQVMSHSESLPPRFWKTHRDDPLLHEFRTTEEWALGVLIDAIAEGIADGTVRADVDPLRTALLLWAEANGIILMARNRRDDLRETAGLDSMILYDDFMKLVDSMLLPGAAEPPSNSSTNRNDSTTGEHE